MTYSNIANSFSCGFPWPALWAHFLISVLTGIFMNMSDVTYNYTRIFGTIYMLVEAWVFFTTVLVILPPLMVHDEMTTTTPAAIVTTLMTTANSNTSHSNTSYGNMRHLSSSSDSSSGSCSDMQNYNDIQWIFIILSITFVLEILALTLSSFCMCKKKCDDSLLKQNRELRAQNERLSSHLIQVDEGDIPNAVVHTTNNSA
jgi:hypothetical protein